MKLYLVLVATIVPLSWLGLYRINLQYYIFDKTDSSSTDVAAPNINNGSTSSKQLPSFKSNDFKSSNNNNNYNALRRRAVPMLCLYAGDEGSTVLTEAMRLHPQVYSPDWRVEPVNTRHWTKEEFTLSKQIDAIRFLLQLPSNVTEFNVKMRKPLSLKEYDDRVGGADALFFKVNVCRKQRRNEETYEQCLKEVFSSLLCGEQIVQHLVLPIRYGFDRACSMFVHDHKQLYKTHNQFGGSAKQHQLRGDASNNAIELSEEKAIKLREKQELYVRNFMELLHVLPDTCPGQQHKTKIHIYDYDKAKATGMEKTLVGLFKDLGLDHDPNVVNLGQFGGRKPGNYCERLFDSESKAIIQQQERLYTSWLQSTCSNQNNNNVHPYPWCASNAIIATKTLQQKKKPTPMLCLYTGDEGSTVLSEAMRLHPQVYSPDWRVEPADIRHWKNPAEFSLQAQLDAIRFLLRLPSGSSTFNVNMKEPLSMADYEARMGDADAIFFKVNVCRKESADKQAYSSCMKEALSGLLCGDEIVQDLVLPIRYGFDRSCSLYIHDKKEYYKYLSQFPGAKKRAAENPTGMPETLEMTQESAKIMRGKQERYIRNFMELLRLISDETCPKQKHKTRIHIYDYDKAKQVGMEESLVDLFGELGLENEPDTVNLGMFGERKPGNYCETLFDPKSRELIQQQEDLYNEFLKSTCDTHSQYPWC